MIRDQPMTLRRVIAANCCTGDTPSVDDMKWLIPLSMTALFASPVQKHDVPERQAAARAKAAGDAYAGQVPVAEMEMHPAGRKALDANHEALKALDLGQRRLKGPEWDSLKAAATSACSNFPPFIEVAPETSECLGLSGKTLTDCVSAESDRINVHRLTALAACEQAQQNLKRFTQRVSESAKPAEQASDAAMEDARASVGRFVDLCRAAAGAYGVAGMKAEKRYYECVIHEVDGISMTDLASQEADVSTWATMVCANSRATVP